MQKHLVYHGQIRSQGARNVETLLNVAMTEGAQSVVLHLCSSGGDVNAGIGLYNYIRAMPMPVHTHNFGFCCSIAATIFLAGEQRTASPLSRFTLHAAAYSEGPRLGQISDNTQLIARPFKDRLAWTDDRINHYFGDVTERHFSPEEAMSMHLVTLVQDYNFPQDPKAIMNVSLPADA